MNLGFIFIFLELLILFFAFLNYKNNEFLKDVCSVVFIIILTVLSGFRYNVGRDFMSYEIMYNDPDNYRNLFIEPVWILFSKVLHMVGGTSTTWFLCTSFVINLFFILAIKRMSKNFYLSVAFYMCIPQLFLESFNIVRQFVAISIIFYWSYLFFEKRYIRFLFIIILASFFHTSALLLLPFFILSRLRIPNIILLLGIFVCFLLRNQFLSLVTAIVSVTPMYANYVKNLVESESNSGLYAIVLLISSLFIIFRFWHVKIPEINILKQLSLFSFCVYLMFYTFQPGMRIGFYMLPYFILLIPYIKDKMKVNLAFYSIGIIFFTFFLFTLKSSLGILYFWRF